MESQKWKMEIEKLVVCWQAMNQSERALLRLWASMMFQIIFCFMLSARRLRRRWASSFADDGFSLRGTRAEILEPELMENKRRVKQIKRAGRNGRVGWFPFVFTQDLI